MPNIKWDGAEEPTINNFYKIDKINRSRKKKKLERDFQISKHHLISQREN